MKLDKNRLKQIASFLVDGKTPLAYHKPSCRINGYMHGVCEHFCVAHFEEKDFEEKAQLQERIETKDSRD